MISKDEKEISQFTGAGNNGIPGPRVAKDVKEGLKRDLGLAATPNRQMVEEVVREIGEIHSHVTHIRAQLTEVTLHGVHGVCVAGRVWEDISSVLEHVPIPRQNIEDEHVNSGDWEKLEKAGRATQM